MFLIGRVSIRNALIFDAESAVVEDAGRVRNERGIIGKKSV